MITKVCGITQLKQLQQLEALKIGYAGFIFYDRSPRYVIGKMSTSEMRTKLNIKKIGVFVNADAATILTTVKDYSLDLVQFHGDESPEFCKLLSDQIKVIKAFRIQDGVTDIDELIAPYKDVCDYYLFDTAATNGSFGGTGKKFNWDVISKAKIEKPFFISGGISIDDVGALKLFSHPDLYGVDINSRFETAPGIKNMPLIDNFSEILNSK